MNNKEQNYQLLLRVGYFLALGYFVYLIYGSVVANYHTNQEIASLKAEIDLLNSEKDYIANLNKVTLEDAISAYEKYLVPENSFLMVLGPEEAGRN